MKQRFLHIFAFLMATLIATPIANAHTFSAPSKAWSKEETTYSDYYYSIAVSGDDIFAFPSISNTGDGTYLTYTKGLRFSSSKVVAFSGGSGSSAFPVGSGSYYYMGAASASDSKGTIVAATRIGGNPSDWPWTENVEAVAYYTSNPSSDDLIHTNPVAGNKTGIKFSTPISGRTDKMSAYGDIKNGTGYLWFVPGSTNNKYNGIERITITTASNGSKSTSKQQYSFPSGITIDNNTSLVKQYSDNCVLLDIKGQNFFKGVISADEKSISWTNLGIKATSGTGATMFILANHEILAYSSSNTQITLYDVTEGKTLYTFTPFSTMSYTGNTLHAIEAKVSGNTASIYVLVPGQGAGKWTMTATAYTNPVTSLKATRVSGTANNFTVSWAKPSAGIPTKYQVQYSSNSGSSWSTAVETTNLNYTYPNLAEGNYTFRVRPYYSCSSTWGEYAPPSGSVATLSDAVVSLNTSLDPATNNVTVSWAKPANTTPEKYRVSYSSNGGSSWSTAVETQNLSQSFSSLPAGSYIFKVAPYYNPYWGNDATVNLEIIDAVTNLKVSRQCYGEGGNSAMGTVDALVTWTGVTGKEYKVYYQTMRRDESGNRVYDNGGAWVELGTTTITSGTEGSYAHKNIQPGDGYDRIYNYKVAPYYSSTGAIGQETIIEGKGKTITAFYQSVPVDVALTQPTEERDGKKLYTFNLQLDIALNDNFSALRLEDNDAMALISKYAIVVDETAAKWLNGASNASEIGTFVQGPVTVVANNCNHYSVDGWYLEVDIEDLKPTDDLSKGTKSLTWRNVNPGIVYQPQVYAISSRAFNFTNAIATLANEPGAEAGKMVVPAPKWTLPNGNNVGITAVAGDFSSFVSNDHYPMGTFQKKGDITTPTNPITITEANTIGTIGATIEPIAIADEVIGTKNADGSYENWTWEIAYTFNLFEKNGDEWVWIRNSQKYGQISSDIETSSMYSNSQDLAFDLVGIPVGIEETTSPDGRSRLVYKPENNKEYKVVVETNYRRTVNEEQIHVVGVSETIIALNPDFETPEVDPNKYSGYLFLEQSTHWDEGNKDDEGNYINGGYYKHYYDAVMNITLKEFQEDYVKYLGYYANPSFTCIGHPTATSNKWTPYQAASILIDEHVVLYNKRNPSFALKQLGYTGSEDWSKLITKSGTFPLKVHYVWAGNEKINAVEDAEFEFEMSANYPILVASTPEFRINKSLIDNKHDLAPANPLSRATNYTLQMITAVNKYYKTLVMDDVVETQLTTGVEAVAFDKGVLMVYPNPAQSEATIRSTTVLGEVKIFTIDGQLVKEFESGETTAKFNVSDLTSGVYVVSASGTTTRMIKK